MIPGWCGGPLELPAPHASLLFSPPLARQHKKSRCFEPEAKQALRSTARSSGCLWPGAARSKNASCLLRRPDSEWPQGPLPQAPSPPAPCCAAPAQVGCTGGGSNFAGLAFPFIREKLAGKMNPIIRAVEPLACPTLTKGKYAYDYGDTAGERQPASGRRLWQVAGRGACVMVVVITFMLLFLQMK